ncbi:MAG: hypothetical protein WBL70_17715 [Candidatus Acidiferrales bacterium]
MNALIRISACAFLCAFFVQHAAAFPPQAADSGATPTIVEGDPALALDYGDGMGFLITHTKLVNMSSGTGESTLRFAVYHWIPGSGSGVHCPGFLWVSKSRVSYIPIASGVPKDDKRCTQEGSDTLEEFQLARNEISFLGVHDGSIELRAGNKTFNNAYFIYDINASFSRKWPQRISPSEKDFANEIAGNWLRLAYENFDDAEQQFLLASEPERNDRNSGDAAEQAGDLRKAFEFYMAALAELPSGARPEREDSLRERIIRVALKLDPRPSIPENANRHYVYALAAIQDGKTTGDISKLDDSIDQLNQALRIAPWWPEAYYNLALVLEERKLYADAARNLKLYLLAAPKAQDAAVVQQKIYQLEYEEGAR